jgi:hypothetical protein
MTVSQITFDCSISYKSVGPAPQPFRPPQQSSYSPAYPPTNPSLYSASSYPGQPPSHHLPPPTSNEDSPYSSYGPPAPQSGSYNPPPSSSNATPYDYRNPGPAAPPPNPSYPPSSNAHVNNPPPYAEVGAPNNRDYYTPSGSAPASGYQHRPADDYYRNAAHGSAPAPYNAPAAPTSYNKGGAYNYPARDEYQQSPRPYDANAYDQSRDPPPPSVVAPHSVYGRDDYYQNRDPYSPSYNSAAPPASSYGDPVAASVNPHAEEYRGYRPEPRGGSYSKTEYDSYSHSDPYSVVAPPLNASGGDHPRDEYQHHYNHELSPRPYETTERNAPAAAFQRHPSGTFSEEYHQAPQPHHERSPRTYGVNISDTTPRPGSDSGSGHGSFDHRPALKIRDEFQYQQTREISPLPIESKFDYTVSSGGNVNRPLAPFPSMNEQGFNREREHDSLSHHSSIFSQHSKSATPSPPSSSPGERKSVGNDRDYNSSSYQQPQQRKSGEHLDDITDDLNALNLAALAYTSHLEDSFPSSSSTTVPIVDDKGLSRSNDNLPTYTQFFSTTSSSSSPASPHDH